MKKPEFDPNVITARDLQIVLEIEAGETHWRRFVPHVCRKGLAVADGLYRVRLTHRGHYEAILSRIGQDELVRAQALLAAIPGRRSVKIGGTEEVRDIPIAWDTQPLVVRLVFMRAAERGWHYSGWGRVYRWRGDGSVYHYLAMTPDRYRARPTDSVDRVVWERRSAILARLTTEIARMKQSIVRYEQYAQGAPDKVPDNLPEGVDPNRFMTASRWRSVITSTLDKIKLAEHKLVDFKREEQ